MTALIGQTTSGRFKNVNLECKHFFSGAAVYADGRKGEVLRFQPVELSNEGLALNVFDKPASFYPVGPGRWAIHFASLPDPVSVRLFVDKRLKGQVASRVPMTICDLALSWLCVSTIAQGIPEVYLPFFMH